MYPSHTSLSSASHTYVLCPRYADPWRGYGRWCYCWGHVCCTVPAWPCQSVLSAWPRSLTGPRGNRAWCWAASSGATASHRSLEATSATGGQREEMIIVIVCLLINLHINCLFAQPAAALTSHNS